MAENPDTATILIEDETFRVDGGKGHTKGIAPQKEGEAYFDILPLVEGC